MDRLMTYLIVPISLIMLPSISGNAFILSVNIMNLIEQKRLCVTDQLITGISVFGLPLEVIELSDWFTRVIESKTVYEGEHKNIVIAFSNTLLLCYLWLSAWLCVHFCLKIVNINQRFYVCLQRGFPKMFPWLLVPSILGSMLVSLPIALEFAEDLSPPNTTLAISNQTGSHGDKIYGNRYRPYNIYFAVYLLGFLLCATSASTIIWSLYRHMRRMRDNAEGSRGPNMEAHIRAIKTIASILIFNINLFIILALNIFKNDYYPWQHILSLIISICHFLGTLNLIIGNRKLYGKLSYILSRCHFFQQCNDSTIG
ncbi:taste receptor type 2 member 40-like [Pelodytes ibericus]